MPHVKPKQALIIGSASRNDMIVADVLKLCSLVVLIKRVSSSGQAPVAYPISPNPITIREDTPAGTSVSQVLATDNEGDTLTYTVASQTPSTPSFSIVGETINSPSGLDAETTTSFSITIRVSDGTSSVNFGVLVVNILDVNDNAPQFLLTSYTATIYDTLSDNSAVVAVTATDPDASDTLVYTITAGNTGTTFSIGAANGQITLGTSSNLNPSTTPTYILTAQVNDGVHTNTTSVVITVLDDPCSPDPCQNSGICVKSGTSYTCNCTSGWVGNDCEIADQCASEPCLNGGTCNFASTWTTFNCSCQFGWLGDTCNIDDPCLPNPCSNSGNCSVTQTYKYTCTCESGYSGTNCTVKEKDEDETGTSSNAAVIAVAVVVPTVILTAAAAFIVVKFVISKKILPKKGDFDVRENRRSRNEHIYSTRMNWTIIDGKDLISNNVAPSYDVL